MFKAPHLHRTADQFLANGPSMFPLRWARQVALQVEYRLCSWTARHGLVLIRIALGIVFLWFGALKFLPASSPIDSLAERTITLITFHLVSPLFCLHTLALWECLIGFGLLFKVCLRFSLLLLFLQLPGTFLPLLFFPHTCWTHFPLVPTFVGHYILKNFVLVAAGIVIAASTRGGRIIAHPVIAKEAARLEVLEEEKALLNMEVSASQGY